MRARGDAGAAHVADNLPLAHLYALADPGAEARHVAVGGLVAVGMANADVVAVFALAPSLLDDAAAGGHDRRTESARPVDAGVHLGYLQDRVASHPETRCQPNVLAAHRAAHQE